MDILEKPVAASDWNFEIQCSCCKAKLNVVADDVYYSLYDCSFYVVCVICQTRIYITKEKKDLPWSVATVAETRSVQQRDADREKKAAQAKKEQFWHLCIIFCFGLLIILSLPTIGSKIYHLLQNFPIRAEWRTPITPF